MYDKVSGLIKLKSWDLPVPPFQIIDISGDKPNDIEKYIFEKIKQVKVPNKKGDSIGVTIRVSLPTDPDRGEHYGLHVVDEKDILKRVISRIEKYGDKAKVILQYTIDAKCSGTVLKEFETAIIQVVPGDLVGLLNGTLSNPEDWICEIFRNNWIKKDSFIKDDNELELLNNNDRDSLLFYIKRLRGKAYLEWSITKNGDLYFYEYSEKI